MAGAAAEASVSSSPAATIRSTVGVVIVPGHTASTRIPRAPTGTDRAAHSCTAAADGAVGVADRRTECHAEALVIQRESQVSRWGDRYVPSLEWARELLQSLEGVEHDRQFYRVGGTGRPSRGPSDPADGNRG